VNYQYGQFRIEGDVVKGWRNSDNVASDRPYYSVREEVERFVTDMRTPPATEPAGAPVAPAPTSTSTSGSKTPPRPAARKPQVQRPDRP